MKILKKGLLDESGIPIICRRCKCEFVLEDRDDICSETIPRFDFDQKKKVVVAMYYVNCPMCNLLINFGDEKYVPSHDYYFMFSRKDWVERFQHKWVTIKLNEMK